MKPEIVAVALIIAACGVVSSCTEKEPLYCDENTPCQSGMVCILELNRCVRADASVNEASVEDGRNDAPPLDGGGDLSPTNDTGNDITSSDLPAPDMGSPDMAAADLSQPDAPPPKKANGAACKLATECKSGQCVDGYCCNSSCKGDCQSCALAGKLGICSTEADGSLCGKETCAAGVASSPQCSGGACLVKKTNCQEFTCDSATPTCRTTCTSAAHCSDSSALCISASCRSWKTHTLPTTKPLTSIWGRSATDLWVGGNDGTIVHYNGTKWTDQSPGGLPWIQINGFWGDAGDAVWAVGDGSTLLKKATATSGWVKVTSPLMGDLRGIWGFGGADIWIVGEQSVAWFNGALWTKVSTPSGYGYFGIWGSSSTDLWVVGSGPSGGAALHYNGSTWTPASLSATKPLMSISGPSSTNVWAVGGGGDLLFYDGKAWKTQSSGTTAGLLHIWAYNASHWITTEQKMALHWEPTGWKQHQLSFNPTATYSIGQKVFMGSFSVTGEVHELLP